MANAVVAQSSDLTVESQRAKVLMAEGKFADAIPIYKHLVEALPGNRGLLLNLGLAEQMGGREREAIPHLEAVIKAQPSLVPALMALGSARLSLGQPKLAIVPLQRAATADPKNAGARGLLADALKSSARFEEAAEQYRQLTDLRPQDPEAWYGLGKSYESVATTAFDSLESRNAQSPYLAALVADTKAQRRQYSGALAFYKQAVSELPDLHGLHAALAEIYRKTNRIDLATEEEARERQLPAMDCKLHEAACQFAGGHDLQAAIPQRIPQRMQARTPELLYWQAKAASELAFQAFFQLGQLPPSVQSHQLQAEIAQNRNQHAYAVREWRAAVELAPHDSRLQQELAISLFLAEDYRAALEHAEPLLKADPRSSQLNFVVGDSFLRLGEPENSVSFLRRALQTDPQLTAADASLGLALSRTGKSIEAIPFLVKALKLDENGDLHYQLARAYQAAGEQAKATAALEQYQTILKAAREPKKEMKDEVPPK